MIDLRDYLLVRAFKCAKYREDFNNGDIFINNATNYWNLENEFQQDKEGCVFSQSGKGFLIKTNSEFKNALHGFSKYNAVLTYLKEKNAGEILAETKNFSIGLDGYLCCFYLLNKSDVSFFQNVLSITSKQEREDIAEFLNKYLESVDTHDCYVSIYDAVIFCNIFFKGMSERGYKIAYGQVKYKDIDETTRIELYKKGNLNSIFFTKPTKYSYQKEFRLLLIKPNEPIEHHVTEHGINIEKSRLASFDYSDLIGAKTI